MRLPEARATTFKAYSSWIYSGDVAEDICTPESKHADIGAAQESLIDLYLLGDTLDDIRLRNKAALMLFDGIRRHSMITGHENVHRIWESTASGSLLRKMMVDLYVWKLERSDTDWVRTYPADFVQEVAITSLKALPLKTWSQVMENRQQYTEPEIID